MHIVVLAGGLSHERDVSERSGRRVAEALKERGHTVEVRDADSTLLNSLRDNKPDVVIPMLHGAAGEDGTLRDVLEALEIPYVGSTPDACRMAFDKPVAKSIVASAGIAVPQGVALPHSTFRELGAEAVMNAVLNRVGLPAIVKPARGGSSLGVTVIREAAALPAAMVSAFAYGEVAIIEQFIEGIEVAVSVVETVVGPSALPAVEIRPDGGVYDYAARYTAGLTEFFCPARLSDDVTARVLETAVTTHLALDLRDLSRSDLIVDRNGGVWFLEVNVAPGMTETSLFPQSVAAAESDLGEIFDTLVHVAVSRGGKS
jgi:D-alanine-D-alanine ligase